MTTCKIEEIQPIKHPITSIWPLQVIQGQDLKVKWNILYDLLYAFHVNFGHNMPDSGDTVP